jgi:2-polyprenyl-6-methoxyphenol hydroxylase-like FAD-dependent oxidoreductase
MQSSEKYNVAIIGAGPAGCTLARLIQVSEAPIKVTIFEGDASPNSRTQGGTLDLHTNTGIAALKKAGLYDAFLKYGRFDGNGGLSLALFFWYLR